jgi:hypothetical protein
MCDPYIHRLTDKYSNFFTTTYFGCLSGQGAPHGVGDGQ